MLDESLISAHVDMIRLDNIISDTKFNLTKSETEKDIELQCIKNYVINGCPSDKNKVREPALYRDQIVDNDGVLYKGNEIIIPQSSRTDILNRLHYNHMGINKTVERARDIVFWPGITKHIEDVVSNCPTCLTFQKETLIPQKMGTRPWEIVAGDLYEIRGKDFLIVVDTYSKFPEVVPISCLTSVTVIDKLKEMFARHGKPVVFCSDSGPQFSSADFNNFLKSWEISHHRMSTPTYSQSNGFIERHVQTVKKVIKKTILDQKDIQLALLEYRNTPVGHNQPSPAQLLFS